jgi:succinate dehydrogenase / fumarate reductase membrane anchor subunit
MVKNITALGRSGLHDWLIQRVSAVVLGVFIIALISFFYQHPQPTFEEWRTWFGGSGMRMFSFLSVLGLSVHAWIGLWTVTTDYINSVPVRMATQIVIIALCLIYIIWGAQLLWSL